MLSPNVKPSQGYPLLAGASIAAQSLAAAAVVNGAWTQLSQDAKWVLLQLIMGAGAGTFQVDVQQATDGAGTGAKALSTAAIAALTAANADADVNLETLLDFTNGYGFIRVVVTCTGGAGTLVAVGVRTGPSAYMS